MVTRTVTRDVVKAIRCRKLAIDFSGTRHFPEISKRKIMPAKNTG